MQSSYIKQHITNHTVNGYLKLHFIVTAFVFSSLLYLIDTLHTSDVTSVTEVRSANARLFASMWRPLLRVIITMYYVAIIFHRHVWCRKLSLCYACIRSSGIFLIP